MLDHGGEILNFIFDLDGTLCFNGSTIDKKIIDTIKTYKDYNHNIAFASARPYRDCLMLLDEELRKELIIGLNGSMAYKNNKLIFSKSIDYSLYLKITEYCLENEIPYFIDDEMNYDVYMEEKISFYKFVDTLNIAKKVDRNDIKNPLKLVIYIGDNIEVKKNLDDMLKSESVVTMYHEIEKLYYINPEDINKSTTIKKFFNDYIAFGNDKNDIQMLENALYSVQVGNYEQLKEFADIQIENDENVVPNLNNLIEELYKKY